MLATGERATVQYAVRHIMHLSLDYVQFTYLIQFLMCCLNAKLQIHALFVSPIFGKLTKSI